MRVPPELRYSATHQWARAEADGTVTVGITDHAQQQLGDVVFIDNPKPGRRLSRGEQCGVIESVKAASDIYAPVGGEVLAVNEALADAPEKVNEDAYAAWMFRLQPDNAADMEALLDASAYLKVAEAEAG